jgi:triosephosphate isomerase
MRVPLVAGNWKLNKTAVEAYQLVSELMPQLRNIRGRKTVCSCSPP